MIINVLESSELPLPDPVMHWVWWLLSPPLAYISNLSNCVWNVMTANAFSVLFSISRLCFILLKHVTLSLFTLYLAWQCFEIKHWVLNFITVTIFSFSSMPHSNSSLKGTLKARLFPRYWQNLLYIIEHCMVH